MSKRANGGSSQRAYDGEIGENTYTVQVLPAVAGAAPKGKRNVLLRIRFREQTHDFIEQVPRSYSEVYIRDVVRRLIAEYWPS
jgi:hypothetical protein